MARGKSKSTNQKKVVVNEPRKRTIKTKATTRSKRKKKNNSKKLFVALIVIPSILVFLSVVFYFIGKILLQSVVVWQELFTIIGLPAWLVSLILAAAVLLIIMELCQ